MTTECINWTGTRASNGYGRKWRGGRSGGAVSAHRLAWEEAHGPIPDGLMVLHHCDNRLCVNVAHLYLGNHLDNMRDRNSRGRQARGERNSQARLTEQQVVEIRRLHASGDSQLSLAAHFNVSRRAINEVVRRDTWRYLP